MASPLKAQGQWPSLAQDMALLTIPNSPVEGIADVCATYRITKEELKAILNVPYFQKLFEQSLADVKSLGSRAGIKYRAMILSQSLAERMYFKATQGGMDDKESLRLLELLLKAAGLDKDVGAAQVNTQVNIALPIPQGIGKVAHCVAAVEG